MKKESKAKKVANIEKEGLAPSSSTKKAEDPLKDVLTWRVILVGVFFSLVVALIGTHFAAKSPIDPLPFRLPPAPDFTGALTKNDVLQQSIRLLEDQVYGPESIAIHPVTGRIIAGMKTGLICEITVVNGEAHIHRALRLVNFDDCDGSYKSMPKCGRPLGMRFAPDNHLLIADAYLGLFSVDLDEEKVYTLFTGNTQVVNDPTRPTRYLNDVDVLPDGRIVISESSTSFDDRDYLYDVLEHRPNGRVLVFDRKSKEVRTLVSGLYFPNGVQVIYGKVFIAELGMARILRFDPGMNEISTFTESLPGYPDNIRLSHDGHLLVAIPQLRTEDDNWLAERPALRAFFTKILARQALTALSEYLATPYGLVLKIDSRSGKIIESYHDPEGKTISEISCAVEDKYGNLYLGSDVNYYIGKAKIRDVV